MCLCADLIQNPAAGGAGPAPPAAAIEEEPEMEVENLMDAAK